MGTILNRRRVYGGNNLPYDAEIEYLESVGNCTINTGYVPQGDDIRILTKIMYNGYTTSKLYINWFNTYVSEETNTYRIIRSGASNSSVYLYNGARADYGSIEFSVSTGSIYYIDFNRNSYNINGVTGNLSALKGSENTAPLKLFSTEFKGRFYSFSVFKNDVLVLDLIPVRVGNVGYMYDKVTKQLFGNTGTGSFILGSDKKLLPSGYKQLEYIQSTGTQYIDTEYKLSSADEVKVEARFVNLSSVSGSSYIFGIYGNNANFGINHSATENYAVWGGSSTKFTPTMVIGAVYDIDMKLGLLTINGTTANYTPSGTFTNTTKSVYLFWANGTSQPKQPVAIYSFQIINNSTIVKNLIPCRRNSDNVLGMYDLVNNTFYTNAGTGDFIAGPDK